MTDMLRYDGRAVLVTGAGRGIGREHAILLASRGAAVMVSDHGTDLFGAGGDAGPAEATVAHIRAAGGAAECCLADLSDERGARAAVDATIEAFGRIDGIVHNAGFTLGGRDFGADTLGRLEAQLAINTRAGFSLAHRAWPVMQAQRFGRIVLTTSTALYGMASSIPYSTAKASVVGLTRGLAEAGAACGITVNALAPAGATRMAENLAESPFRTWFLRTMRPELVSPVVAVLLHDKCTVTGEIFVAGGGRVGRVVLAETHGYVSPDLSPEELWAQLPGILGATDYEYPRSTAESGALAARLLGSDLAEPFYLSAGKSPAQQASANDA